MNIPICDLCGLASLDVRPGIAEFPDGFRSIHRCIDHEGCRERVFLAGEEWPLIEKAEVPA